MPTGTDARQRLAKWEREAEQIRAGVLSGKELAQARKSRDPIEEHFIAFEGRQSAKQVSLVYLKNTMSALRRIATECEFSTLADLDAEPVERWQISRRTEGMTARTRNGYREAWIIFANWCVETGRLAANPFLRLPLANVKTDRRKTRRALTEAELGKLLNVARDRALNARLKERLDGKPAILSPAYRATPERNGRIRALIYKTFILTGLRFNELRSLTVGDVRFDGTPRIELPAAKEKNRKGSRIPLRPDLADDLKAYLDERTREAQTAIHARERFLPVPLHLVRHLKEDLKAAGIPTVDERGHILDIHALRHTFNTLLAKGGVNQRIAQELMRHSDPRLTANVYTDLGIGDTSGALHALPALPLHVGPIRPVAPGVALDLVPPSQNQSIRVIEHDTGTDGDQWNETLKIAGYVNEKCPESTLVNSSQL